MVLRAHRLSRISTFLAMSTFIDILGFRVSCILRVLCSTRFCASVLPKKFPVTMPSFPNKLRSSSITYIIYVPILVPLILCIRNHRESHFLSKAGVLIMPIPSLPACVKTKPTRGRYLRFQHFTKVCSLREFQDINFPRYVDILGF